jgi:hypothetical protein
MSDKRKQEGEEPNYVGWRGELLARMALARIPGLIANEPPKGAVMDVPYDFVVVADRGFCFLVEVKAYSSARRKLNAVADEPDLRWSLSADLIRRARRSQTPIFLFLFDADTEHGRFLRLDTLPEPKPGTSHVVVDLPISQTIDPQRLLNAIAELEATTRV